MQRSLSLSAITLLSLLGIADSAYLTDHALTNTALSCGIDGALSGCNVVAQSAYSHLFGMPLAIYGIVFYSVLLVLSIFMRYRPGRRPSHLLMLAATAGVALSLYFVGLQVFVIQALCVYCLASFAFSVLIFVLAILLLRLRPGPLPPAM